jgi:hypothetical protein
MYDTVPRIPVATDMGVAEEEDLILRREAFELIPSFCVLFLLCALQVFERTTGMRGIFNLVVDFPAFVLQ